MKPVAARPTAAAVAAQRLLDKEVGKIIVTRPVLQAEEDLGFLPGDMSEKFAPFFRPVYDVLQKRLGGSFLEYCLKPEVAKVEIAPSLTCVGALSKTLW